MQNENLTPVIEAARASVEIAHRIESLDVECRGLTTEVPIGVGANGTPAVLVQAWEIARDEAKRAAPDRAGNYKLDDLASLIKWSRRYGTSNTIAFVKAPDDSDGRVTVIVDELPPAAPKYVAAADGSKMIENTAVQDAGAHRWLRAYTELPLHPRLDAWLESSEGWMSAEVFHAMLDRASEELGSAEVLSMATNIEVHNETSWSRTVDPNTGAVKLAAEDKTTTTKVPKTFQFVVPVFAFDDEQNAQTFTARLSIKVERGKPVFRYDVVDYAPRMAQAIKQIQLDIGAAVSEVYAGSPP